MSAELESFRRARIRAVSSACVFLVVSATATMVLEGVQLLEHMLKLANYVALVATCAITLVFVRRHPAAMFKFFLIAIQSLLLVGIWYSGGVRRPLPFIEVPLLLLSSFLVGSRLTWVLCTSFAVNTVALAWCEVHGFAPSAPTQPVAFLFLLAVSSAFGLYFVAKPLALAQNLVETARINMAKRADHEQELSNMNERLDIRIAEREKELSGLRQRLNHGTEVLSSSYEPIIQRITVRARYIQETLKAEDETVLFPVERILAGCDRLTRMHKAISRFSRLGPRGVNPQELDADSVRSMIRPVWDEIRQGYPRADHRLFLNEITGCRADPELLRQIWQNLLSNAAKFSARQPKPRIVVGSKNGEYYVNDNGVGFDSNNAKGLFDMFNRQHPSDDFAGDGIGLASAHRIVQLHDGSIRIVSEPAKGTTVFFRMDPTVPEAS